MSGPANTGGEPPARYVAALRLIRAAVGDYDQAVKAPTRSLLTPDAFCTGLRERVAGLLDAGDGYDWDGFVAWAATAGAPRLLHVLAARAALDEADATKALHHAETATALDHRDAFAHALYLEARALADHGSGRSREDLSGFFCARPFEEFEVRADGEVYTCCSAWLPVPIGNVRRDAPDAIWNSAAAQAVRASILDGSFRHCSRLNCPVIVDRRLQRRDRLAEPAHREIVATGRTRLERGPLRVLMSQDRSCNLTCPSCRTHPILAGKAEQDRLNELAETTLLPLLADARQVKVTGSGDPFASAHFRYLLRRLSELRRPGLAVQLQTNGVLLDARAWDALGLDGLVDSLWVSIDAAEAATYAIVRRGGDWYRLLDNIGFLAGLRRSGRIAKLRLDFVVQALNYREMPAAAELARAAGCDGIYFQMIRNWGTYTVGEFREHFIGSPRHPEHAAFLDILRHPSLDWEGVDMSNVRALRELSLRQLSPSSRSRSGGSLGSARSASSHAAAAAP